MTQAIAFLISFGFTASLIAVVCLLANATSRRWGAQRAADPCGHGQHKWSPWRPCTRTNTLAQERNCQRAECNLHELRTL